MVKAHELKKNNLWWLMTNFDHLSNSTWFSVITGTLYGCIYYLRTSLEVDPFTWRNAIKSGEGIIYAVILALSVKVATDFYTLKVKPKIFKDGKINESKTGKGEDKAA